MKSQRLHVCSLVAVALGLLSTAAPPAFAGPGNPIKGVNASLVKKGTAGLAGEALRAPIPNGRFDGRLEWYSDGVLLFTEEGSFEGLTQADTVLPSITGNGDDKAFAAMYEDPATSILSAPRLAFTLLHVVKPARGKNPAQLEVLMHQYFEPAASALWATHSVDGAQAHRDVAAEQARAVGAEAHAASDLAGERGARVAADAAMQGALASEVAARTADAAAVEAVRAQLGAEVARSQAAEAGLQSAVSAEAAARAAADAAVLAAGQAYADQGLAGESARARAAEAMLSTMIAAELARANAAEAGSAAALLAEATERQSGDQALMSYVDDSLATEAAARATGQQELSAAIASGDDKYLARAGGTMTGALQIDSENGSVGLDPNPKIYAYANCFGAFGTDLPRVELQWNQGGGFFCPTPSAKFRMELSGPNNLRFANLSTIDLVHTSAAQTTALHFREAAGNGSNWVGLRAPAAIGANVLWDLPAADGAANAGLITDGNGHLSWGPDFATLLANEAAARIAGDINITNNLNAEAAQRAAADSAQTNNLNAEIAARIAGDAANAAAANAYADAHCPALPQTCPNGFTVRYNNGQWVCAP